MILKVILVGLLLTATACGEADKLRGAHAASAGPPGPTSACTRVSGAQVLGASSIPENPAPAVNATLAEDKAQSLCAITLSQRPLEPGGYNCPNDNGTFYRLVFAIDGAPSFEADVDATGCRFITTTIEIGPLETTPQFWATLDAVR